jgi:phage terminase small subunit
MAKRGPKPKPLALRLLEGNPGRRPLPLDDVVIEAPAQMPEMVASSTIAAEAWNRVLSFMPPGFYTAEYEAALTAYAIAWEMSVCAKADIERLGRLIEVPVIANGVQIGLSVKANPAVKMWHNANDALAKALNNLGLNGTQKAKLREPKSTIPNKFDGLIRSLPS